MKKFSQLLLTATVLLGLSLTATAQEKKESYEFTPVKVLKITPIQNQGRSSTCWSFSGLGFLEIEALRESGMSVSLAPMYVVAQNYKDKADEYIRWHGSINFGPGGSFGDVLNTVKHHGIVPIEEMTGLNYGTDKHVHNEIHALASGYVNALLKEMSRSGSLSPAWKEGYNGIIDSYLGKAPESFVYNGVKYTPESFRDALGLKIDDYVSITSFTHHPFYDKFILEIPDNWRLGQSYNVPLKDMMAIIDNAINNDYAVAWGTDVSEEGFTRDGLGILIDTESSSNRGSDQARWVGVAPSDRHKIIAEMIRTPGTKEIEVTQEWRQNGFNDLSTQDDHGMVIFGISKDQTGKKFYNVKNSWGETGEYKGIWYVSESFVAGKTINIVVHKNAIPKDIRKKLGI
ncbi:C1 family peptidase [Porphyromonadaceae bacterium W3.11]|nr:C1 family peptidase [Porphyromonadaceae bacterium W3.11]